MTDDPRYAGLPLDEIKQELTPEDYQVFLDTVGSVEVPLSFYIPTVDTHYTDAEQLSQWRKERT